MSDMQPINLLEAVSLPRLWSAHWRSDPAATAIVDLASDTPRELTRGELDNQTAVLAYGLAAHGVGPGSRVLFSGSPSLDYLLLYVATLRLGATIVPANTAYLERELAHIVADSGASFAVIDDPERAAWLDIPTLAPGGPLKNPGEVAPALDAAQTRDLGMIAYTSGTTGRPKGAMLTHGNLLASAESLRYAWRWTAEDGLVLALPLFHLHGLGVGVHGSLAAGARVLLLSGFDAGAVSTAAARVDATMFFGVPTMYQRLANLLDQDASAGTGLASLRLLVSGSAPLSAGLWDRIAEQTGQHILERYGMTETVMLLSNPYEGERRPGAVGYPLPGVEVRLAGGGDSGEIEVRGPNVFAGYLGNDAATAEAFTADGYFRTGDIGAVGADGSYAIVGRSKELIISGGYNVYPREVEEALEEHPGVREAAVVGLPSPEWGESVAAVIVAMDPTQPPPVEELVAHCAQRLAGYKKPRRVAYAQVLPRNAMGKVTRRELPALFAD